MTQTLSLLVQPYNILRQAMNSHLHLVSAVLCLKTRNVKSTPYDLFQQAEMRIR